MRRARRRASRTAAALRIHVSSSIPLPRPTTATGSAPVIAATSTEAGVVAPTPIAAGHQQVRAGVDLVVGQRPADVDGALGLVLGERVRPVDAARAGADAVARVGGERAVRGRGVGGAVDGHVDDAQRPPGGSASTATGVVCSRARTTRAR